jgi:hypothetical protein
MMKRSAWLHLLLTVYLLSGVNYFFGLATTISPDQRRLLFDT